MPITKEEGLRAAVLAEEILFFLISEGADVKDASRAVGILSATDPHPELIQEAIQHFKEVVESGKSAMTPGQVSEA